MPRKSGAKKAPLNTTKKKSASKADKKVISKKSNVSSEIVLDAKVGCSVCGTFPRAGIIKLTGVSGIVYLCRFCSARIDIQLRSMM